MKKLTKISAISILMIGSGFSVFGQASATATASATIIIPIAITKTVDMNFGTAAVQAGTGGTIVLTPAGGRTVTGGVTLPNVTGTVTAASFNVTGEGTSTYSITLPVAPLTITSGINTMTVSTFTSTPTPTGTLTAGAQTLLVGGTLNVAAAQAPGTYISGTPFTVTVNYN
ncbi:MAG: DUF4402 domain-containing protein [Bacteroidota bacterium]